MEADGGLGVGTSAQLGCPEGEVGRARPCAEHSRSPWAASVITACVLGAPNVWAKSCCAVRVLTGRQCGAFVRDFKQGASLTLCGPEERGLF